MGTTTQIFTFDKEELKLMDECGEHLARQFEGEE